MEPSELRSLETVPKLKETFDRVRCNLQSEPAALAKSLKGIEALEQDRVHGATFLGRRAIELLATVAETSEASTIEELFCDFLIVASRLRNVQPGMAIVRNLVGMLLYQADLKRGSGSISAFKSQVSSLAMDLVGRAQDSAEDAARNAAALLPTGGHVLTHSYSSNVLRALELGIKGGKELQVYATESYPGMEGKRFANDLVGLGVPVRLVADSAVASIIPDVNLVLVGADSVLADGSLVHKVGTKAIATDASERRIPVYSVCETTKFSTADFLREPLPPLNPLFDVTPSNYISRFVTESGLVEPTEVEGRIRTMLREMYP